MLIEKILQAFSFTFLHQCVILKKHIENTGFSFDDLEKYVNHSLEEAKKALAMERSKKNEEFEEFKKLMPSCPECGESMWLSVIKTPQGKSNVYGYQSMFTCSNNACMHQIYNKPNYQEMMELLRDGDYIPG